ncbi:hypothetical protein M413DRAFT_121419 [Hebeloma cylindrosporum]|uniref:Uncharacterized protein n=1 Tax=Hebeloma cylindrosporum TaxID=76867 RepID=A0A0C3CEP8_HEBCY|nr:hypothetical protein M413DRAFT_121419 [Hebeloma cylindrosporum h7]
MNMGSGSVVGASSLDAIHVIDNEIEVWSERIRVRRSHRNNLVPISKIPVELLSYIFSLVQRKYRHESRENLGWIVVTHVCQRWRGIALNNPSLWVYIPFHCPDWVPEMTKRSKSAILKVELNSKNFMHFRFHDLREFLDIHISRIQKIKCYGSRKAILRTLFQHLPPHSARSLEHLNLCHAPQGPNTMTHIERLLAEPSRLRTLKLHGPIDWSSKVLSSLTHFAVHYNDSLPNESPPTYPQFFDALARMPALQILELHDVPLPPELATKFPIVYLSQLKSIHLMGSAPIVSNMLRHISFPESTRFQLTLDISMASDVALVSALFGGRNPSTKPVIKWPLARSLRLTVENGQAHITAWSYFSQETVNFSGWSFPDADDSFLRLSLPCLLLSSTPDRDDIMAQAILEACSATPFQNLLALSVVSEEELAGVNRESLTKAFGRQPQLHSANVEGPALKAFLGFMAGGNEDLSQAPDTFPSLRRLSIYAGIFKKGCLSAGVLQDMLRHRKEFGMELEHVDFKCCTYLRAKDAKDMGEHVRKVTWDEVDDDSE